jgi:hypothetical protein
VLGKSDGSNEPEIWFYIAYSSTQGQYLTQRKVVGPLIVDGGCFPISVSDQAIRCNQRSGIYMQREGEQARSYEKELEGVDLENGLHS